MVWLHMEYVLNMSGKAGTSVDVSGHFWNISDICFDMSEMYQAVFVFLQHGCLIWYQLVNEHFVKSNYCFSMNHYDFRIY